MTELLTTLWAWLSRQPRRTPYRRIERAHYLAAAGGVRRAA